jgi:hypothetical protein
MDVGETGGPHLVITHNDAEVFESFVGMAFGELNVVPQSQAIVVQHCKKILNTTTKP